MNPEGIADEVSLKQWLKASWGLGSGPHHPWELLVLSNIHCCISGSHSHEAMSRSMTWHAGLVSSTWALLLFDLAGSLNCHERREEHRQQ
jgi:hypothetical protein